MIFIESLWFPKNLANNFMQKLTNNFMQKIKALPSNYISMLHLPPKIRCLFSHGNAVGKH